MDALHDLIQKLTAAEKGYLKKFLTLAKRNESSASVRLFDELAAMPEYDEDLLRKKLRKEKLVQYLPVAKANLLEQLQRALALYHRETTIYQHIDALWNESSMLVQKNAIALYRKTLARIKQLCEESEYFGRWLEVIDRQVHDTLVTPHSQERVQRLKSLISEGDDVRDKQENLRQFTLLYARQMELTSQSYQLRDEQMRQAHLDIIASPLMQHADRALSTKALLYYYHNWFIYYSVFHEEDKAYAIARQMLASCRNSKVYTEHEPFPLLTAYLYAMNGAYRNQDTATMETLIEELRGYSFKMDSANRARFMYYMKNALFHYSEHGTEEKFLSLVEEADETLKAIRYQIRKDYLLVIFDHCALGLMKFGHYQQAIDWLELYRQHHRYAVRYDLQVTMHFHLMVAHFELGNLLLVDHLIVPTYRFIVRNGQQSDVEKLAMRTFRVLARNQDERHHTAALLKLQEGLRDAGESDITHRNKDLRLFLLDFIESKLQKKSYHEWIRRSR